MYQTQLFPLDRAFTRKRQRGKLLQGPTSESPPGTDQSRRSRPFHGGQPPKASDLRLRAIINQSSRSTTDAIPSKSGLSTCRMHSKDQSLISNISTDQPVPSEALTVAYPSPSLPRYLPPYYMHMFEKQDLFKDAPIAAKDLIWYTDHVNRLQHGLPSPIDGKINTGKVNPSKYGSILQKDLGLCYETFFTSESCRHGSRCRWRHDELTMKECQWLEALGARCVLRLVVAWETPKIPELTQW
ncbi:hypothetical protein EK21DRAFT_118723 [Setomelanomma holmii]|uniref:C3H1-type domain-containing protein n=1 Tax=Setomelanomma holmii TaxID=210430 RepID=A0A9P4GVH4_9PLEO|nr:hypothetical protein EK21DRAFT_118723 [Setomelanomma holmii]